jgi:uncharacterized membrane protein
MPNLHTLFKRIIFHHYLLFIFLLIFAASFYYVTQPVFQPGLFITHDDVQVVRIQEMYKELEGGQFPVRYVSDFANGGGYMLFNFYSPGVYYLGALFYALGVNSIAAVKLLYLTAFSIGTTGIFLLSKNFTKRNELSVLAAVLFLLAPYTLFNAFHRGALPEFFAMMTMPLSIHFFIHLLNNKSRTSFLAASLFYSLLIVQHVLTAFIATIIIITLCVSFYIFNRRFKEVFLAALAGMFGLLLSAFFFLPALAESSLTKYSQSWFVTEVYQYFFVTPTDLFGANFYTDELRATIGPLLTLGFIIYIAYFLRHKQRGTTYLNWFVLLAGCLLFILYSPTSKLLWDNLELLRYLQFPFRLLTAATLISCLSLIILLEKLATNHTKRIFLSVMIIAISFWFSIPYATPIGYNFAGVYRAEGACPTTAWDNEHFTKFVEECLPPESINKPIAESQDLDLEISNVQELEHGRLIYINTNGRGGEIDVRKYYYPSWKALNQDGKELRLKPYGMHGTIRIEVDEGDDAIHLRLGSTFWQLAGNLITVISATFFLILSAHNILYRNKPYLTHLLNKPLRHSR